MDRPPHGYPAQPRPPADVAWELDGRACQDLAKRVLPGIWIYPSFLAVVWSATSYGQDYPEFQRFPLACVLAGVGLRLALHRWRALGIGRFRRGWKTGVATSVALMAVPCGAMLGHSILAYGYSHWNVAVVQLWTTSFVAGSIITFTPNFRLLLLHVLLILVPGLAAAAIRGGSQSAAYGIANVLLMLFVLGQGRRLLREYQERALDLYREEERRREVEQARESADAASRAKSQFLANMSHEIRTPLHGILGMADLVLAAPLAAEQRDYLETLRNSATSLQHILNDILDLSKVEAGRLELESVPFRPREVVEACRRTFDAQARLKGLQLASDVTGQADKAVNGDPTRLRQVLLNLTGNALKFTAEGGVTLGLTVRPATAGLLRLHFAVRDTGPGVPDEKQSLIFEAFSQADSSVARLHGGTGLGLAISSRLVELMGSRIELVSSAGAGSTFSFAVELPLASTEEEPTTPEASGAPLPPWRILLVEDNPVNQRVALATLGRLGLDTTVASNGREALALFTGLDFDLVLMDSHMPEMDGLTAARHIRAWETSHGRRRTPIIAVTADAMAGDRERFLAADMDGYLAKPFRPAQLAEALRQHAPVATAP